MSSKDTKDSEGINVKTALMNLLNSSSEEGNQFVTFSIGNEEYGIEINSVQEITAFQTVTPLPNTPRFVKGILNLRGHVIPIIDPRVRFEMQEVEYEKTSVIIIFKTQEKVTGMIVDKISDVLTIDKASIEDTPDMAVNISTDYLSGVGKVKNKFVIILNVEKIFSSDEAMKFEDLQIQEGHSKKVSVKE